MRSSHHKSGFTLIELLIVIAIISLLAAMLFPVFARARENARRASCQSNLKQIGIGMMQYTQDYDERFPIQCVAPPVAVSGPVGWADTIQPYIKSLQIYQCPSDTTGPQTTADPAASGYTDYYINAALGTATIGATANYTGGGVSQATVSRPSLTILNGEGVGSSTFSTARYRCDGHETAGTDTSEVGIPDNATPGLATTGSLFNRHLEGVNLSFVDGHVKWYSIQGAGSGVVKNGTLYNSATPFSTSQSGPTFAVGG